MPAAAVDDYLMRIAADCRDQYILRLVEPDPDDLSKRSAVTQNARVSTGVDFEEVDPGSTRVGACMPRQIFKSSEIGSMFGAFLNPRF